MRLIHVADSHIGPARSRLDPETGINARLIDFARCTKWAIDDGVNRGAEVVLMGGDLFNTCRPSPNERRLGIDSLMPALAKNIPVILLLGNHDAARSPAERNALDVMREVPGLTIVDRPEMLYAWRDEGIVCVDYPDELPESREIALQIACFPWPSKNLLLADEEMRALEPGTLNQVMSEKVLDVLRGLASQLDPGIPSVLLAHLSVDMADAGGGRMMLLGGDWTVNVHDLAGLGFDAILLGHIHKPQMLCETPPIVYSGSPEAVSFGEEGEPRRYCLWTFDEGAVPTFASIETPYRTFWTVDLYGPPGPNDTYEHLRDGIVRVRIAASAEASPSEIRQRIMAAGAVECTVEVERAESVRRRETGVTAQSGLEESIRAWVKQKPDLERLTDELIAVAHEIEGARVKGGAA